MVLEDEVYLTIPLLNCFSSVDAVTLSKQFFPSSSTMASSSCRSHRAVSTENLLAPPEEVFTPLLPKPRIIMGESGDSGDSLLGPSGQYLNLYHDPPGGTRSVPDIEMHARDTRPDGPSTRAPRNVMGHVRCSCSHLPRASSKESVRSVQNNEVLVVAPSSYR